MVADGAAVLEHIDDAERNALGIVVLLQGGEPAIPDAGAEHLVGGSADPDRIDDGASERVDVGGGEIEIGLVERAGRISHITT